MKWRRGRAYQRLEISAAAISAGIIGNRKHLGNNAVWRAKSGSIAAAARAAASMASKKISAMKAGENNIALKAQKKWRKSERNAASAGMRISSVMAASASAASWRKARKRRHHGVKIMAKGSQRKCHRRNGISGNRQNGIAASASISGNNGVAGATEMARHGWRKQSRQRGAGWRLAAISAAMALA